MKNRVSCLHVTQSRATGHDCLLLHLTTVATCWMSMAIAACGLHPDKEAIRVVVSLRLGCTFFESHACHMLAGVVPPLTLRHALFFLQAKSQQNIASQLRQWRYLALADSRRRSQHEGTARSGSWRRQAPWWLDVAALEFLTQYHMGRYSGWHLCLCLPPIIECHHWGRCDRDCSC